MKRVFPVERGHADLIIPRTGRKTFIVDVGQFSCTKIRLPADRSMLFIHRRDPNGRRNVGTILNQRLDPNRSVSLQDDGEQQRLLSQHKR